MAEDGFFYDTEMNLIDNMSLSYMQYSDEVIVVDP